MSDGKNHLPMHIADQQLPVSILGGQCEWLPVPQALGEWCVAAVHHWSFPFQNFLCIVGGSHQGLLKKTTPTMHIQRTKTNNNNTLIYKYRNFCQIQV